MPRYAEADHLALLEKITVEGDRERDTAVAARNWFNGVTPPRAPALPNGRTGSAQPDAL